MFAESLPERRVGVTAEGGRTAYVPLVTRFVALGDSLTEGVGDPHPAWPNGLRGWADLVAARLCAVDSDLEYANLALRGRTARDVVTEQLPVALSLRPDVVTMWAGGNDILRPVVRLDDVLASIDHALDRLVGAAGTVVVLTGFEVTGSPVLRPVRDRVRALNAGLREVARARGAVVADVSGRAEWADRRLWAPDRVHPSAFGHARLASVVGRLLGLEEEPDRWGSVGADDRPGFARAAREQLLWWRAHVAPHMRRWATGASRRETVLPKWVEPVRPAVSAPWFGPGNDPAGDSVQPH